MQKAPPVACSARSPSCATPELRATRALELIQSDRGVVSEDRFCICTIYRIYIYNRIYNCVYIYWFIPATSLPTARNASVVFKPPALKSASVCQAAAKKEVQACIHITSKNWPLWSYNGNWMPSGSVWPVEIGCMRNWTSPPKKGKGGWAQMFLESGTSAMGHQHGQVNKKRKLDIGSFQPLPCPQLETHLLFSNLQL